MAEGSSEIIPKEITPGLFNPIMTCSLFTREEAGYLRPANRADALRHSPAAFGDLDLSVLDLSFCAALNTIGFEIH